MRKSPLIFSLALFSLSGSAAASPDAIDKSALLVLSNTYSKCAAYYEIAAASLAKMNKAEAESESKELQQQAGSLALSIAEEMFSAEASDPEKARGAAKQFVDRSYAAALSEFHDLARNDQDRLKKRIATYGTGCRHAISNPHRFSEAVRNRLAVRAQERAKAPGPTVGEGDIDSEDILRRLNEGKQAP
jgi:hypothetical protein